MFDTMCCKVVVLKTVIVQYNLGLYIDCTFDVLSEMEKTFGAELGVDPVSLILGLPSRLITLKNGERLYCVLTYAARKSILSQWINKQVATVWGRWRVLMDFVPSEHTEYENRLLLQNVGTLFEL